MGAIYISYERDGRPGRWFDRARVAVMRTSVLTRLIALLAVAVTVERVWLGFGVPLWLDETWTAMIATRPTWVSFWREAYLDVNAPLYYVFMKLWTDVLGTSNAMLRLPSLLFINAAAVLPLVWRVHGLDRRAALVWSALILLWWPGIIMSVDARTYGLLLFASTGGAIAFIRAMREAHTRHFLVWAAIGATQMLAHYFAYFLVAIQGLVLLWRWRFELVRRWYAFVPFTAPFAWTAYHLPRVLEYGRPGVAWYDPTNLDAALYYVVYTIGAPSSLFPALLLLGLGGALWKSGWATNPLAAPVAEPAPDGAAFAVRSAVFAGVCALATMIVVGALKASLTDRYLVPLVPTMLLGVVLLAHRVRRSEVAYLLVVIVVGTFSLKVGAAEKELKTRSNYGYERASDFVEAGRPEQLIFLWDHSNAQILDETSLKRIGDFFFVRHGLPIETTALRLTRFDDPNVAIQNAVKRDRAAVIWLYDAQRNSAAKLYPPRLARNPAWKCREVRSLIYRKETRMKELWVGTAACVTISGGK